MEVARPITHCGCDHCLGWYPGVEKTKTRSSGLTLIIFFLLTGCAVSSPLELCGLDSPPWWTVPQGVLRPWLPTGELYLELLCWNQPSFLELLLSGYFITRIEKWSNRYNKRHKQKHYAKDPGEAAVYNLTPKSKNLKLSTPIKFSGRVVLGFIRSVLK